MQYLILFLVFATTLIVNFVNFDISAEGYLKLKISHGFSLALKATLFSYQDSTYFSLWHNSSLLFILILMKFIKLQ